jgi:hypothetical protein
VDGGIVTIIGRIGVGNPGGQRFACGYWKYQTDRNAKHNCSAELLHFFFSPLLGRPRPETGGPLTPRFDLASLGATE